MKKEDLDNYFIKMPQLMQSGNQDEMLQVLLSLASEEIREKFKDKKLEEYSIDDEKILSENIMEQIQQSGLYEYLLQKGLQKENTSMVEDMLLEDSIVPVNIAKQIINNDELLGEINDVIGLIEKTRDEQFITDCLNNNNLSFKYQDIMRLLGSVKDVDCIRKCIYNPNLGIREKDLVRIVQSTNNFEFIKEIVQDGELGLLWQDKLDLIKNTNNLDFIKECIADKNIHLSSENIVELIGEFDTGEKFEILEFVPEGAEEISKLLRRRGDFDIKTIEENLDMFFKWENIDNTEAKAKILDELKQSNEEILKNIDFRLLEEKYVKNLGKDGINRISNFPDIQEEILALTDDELKAFSMMIGEYENDESKWRYMTTSLLSSLTKNNNYFSYDSLLREIDDFTESDVKKLSKIMQNRNIFGIGNIEDLRNYEQIKQEKCDEWINSKDIEKRREALLYKVFGQDIRYTQNILKRYGEDIAEIENDDIKSYVTALKEIMSIEDGDIIARIYKEVPEIAIEDIDKVSMESALSNEYGKLYNKGLVKPESLDKIEENVYDAGTDFNILMTAIGAYQNNEGIKNYKEDWNRPSLSSPHICCSYIRNDMLGTAPINNICYGFSEMGEGSLVESGSHDVYSNITGLVSKAGHGSVFYSPDNQINKTYPHNEMDYSRFQNGQKKQPDYILVFKENGKIEYLEESKQASKDWGGMPIVVVDREKVLQSEKQKLDNLLEQYEAGDSSVAREIYYKIRNNRVSNKSFAEDIDIDKFRREMREQEKEQDVKTEEKSKVTKEDLQQNSEQITAEERKQEVSKMKQLLHRIQSITREERE